MLYGNNGIEAKKAFSTYSETHFSLSTLWHRIMTQLKFTYLLKWENVKVMTLQLLECASQGLQHHVN